MKNFFLLAVCTATLSVVPTGIISAQQAAAPAPAPQRMKAYVDPPITPEGAEVLKFERDMEAAVVRGDVPYIEKISAPDLSFTHGDGWATGSQPLLVDDRATFIKRVASKQYSARDLDHQKVEMHGDIAITYGRYIARNNIGPEDRRWFSVWFERVYAKRNGQWYYVSHRTVHGPTYGPDQASLQDK
jgi:hypothetical protein